MPVGNGVVLMGKERTSRQAITQVRRAFPSRRRREGDHRRHAQPAGPRCTRHRSRSSDRDIVTLYPTIMDAVHTFAPARGRRVA